MSLFFYLLEGLGSLVVTFGVELLFLAALLISGVLIAGVLAPLGALTWWAGWSRKADRALAGQPPAAALHEPHRLAPPNVASSADQPDHFLVYLSGIGDISGTFLHQAELRLMRDLQEKLPRTTIIHNIFAYSVQNIGLTEEERLGRFWRWMQEVKLSKAGRAAALGGVMINGRNLLQVAVSADRRYGPVFSYGTASTIYRGLREAGFEPGAGVPVTLLGYSGGAQVVLGAAQYLKPALDTPLQVISLGGVLADSAGIMAADEVVHLEGARDTVQRQGGYLFPARWPIARTSRWNRALAAGKLRRIATGPMTHNGKHGYLDPEAALDDGRSHLEATVELITGLMHTFRAKGTT